MAYDMTNSIIDHFVSNFKDEINVGLVSTDNLWIKEVTRDPIQDDPTKRAPYLAIQPDKTLMEENSHYRVPVTGIRRGQISSYSDVPQQDVGGGFLMLNFFLIEGWLKRVTTREEAYLVGGGVLRRLESAFARMVHHDMELLQLTTDDGLETMASYPNIFGSDGGHFYLGGGDRTWLPQITFRFHLYTEIRREYWGL